MASENSLYDLREEDLDRVSAGTHINRIAIVVRTSDQTITQTSGSQLDVITNNNWIIQAKPIGKPST
jgi:hypothetical protein